MPGFLSSLSFFMPLLQEVIMWKIFTDKLEVTLCGEYQSLLLNKYPSGSCSVCCEFIHIECKNIYWLKSMLVVLRNFVKSTLVHFGSKQIGSTFLGDKAFSVLLFYLCPLFLCLVLYICPHMVISSNPQQWSLQWSFIHRKLIKELRVYSVLWYKCLIPAFFKAEAVNC
jgi:hypothetical protein